jgi:hypothetical protein
MIENRSSTLTRQTAPALLQGGAAAGAVGMTPTGAGTTTVITLDGGEETGIAAGSIGGVGQRKVDIGRFVSPTAAMALSEK